MIKENLACLRFFPITLRERSGVEVGENHQINREDGAAHRSFTLIWESLTNSANWQSLKKTRIRSAFVPAKNWSVRKCSPPPPLGVHISMRTNWTTVQWHPELPRGHPQHWETPFRPIWLPLVACHWLEDERHLRTNIVWPDVATCGPLEISGWSWWWRYWEGN